MTTAMQILPRMDKAISSAVLPMIGSARKWDIEYGGFLSNHITHNWVVLACSGASDDKLQWWTDTYSSETKLEPARAFDANTMPVVTADNVVLLRSNVRLAYPAFLRFFDECITKDGLVPTVQRYAPIFMPGMLGSALHPVIHTGFALEVGSESMCAEGLAYMATSYQPVDAEPGEESGSESGDRLWTSLSSSSHATAAGASPNASSAKSAESGSQCLQIEGENDMLAATLRLIELAKVHDLVKKAKDGSDLARFTSTPVGAFQRRTRAICDAELGLGKHILAVGPLVMPALDQSLAPAVRQATTLITALFLASKCEFFVLHGVTSLHALLVLLPLLTPQQQRDALAYWWRAIMVVLVAEKLLGAEEAALIINQYLCNEKEGAQGAAERVNAVQMNPQPLEAVGSVPPKAQESVSPQKKYEKDSKRQAAGEYQGGDEEGTKRHCKAGAGAISVGNEAMIDSARASDGPSEQEKQAHGPAVMRSHLWWQDILHRSQNSHEEHVSKAAYAFWRWSKAAGEAPTSDGVAGGTRTMPAGLFRECELELFAQAAALVTRPNKSGQIEDNIFFA